MKMKIKNIFSAVAAAAMLTACVGDLNTLPLNPTDVTSETVYGADEQGYLQGLTTVYFQFVSNDLTGLQLKDGGASEFIRAFWSTQEVTADAAKCAWSDPWVNDLNKNTWKGNVLNDAVYASYVRALQGVAFVNEYLRKTTPELLAERGVSAELAQKIESFRAEARFLRAYFYWATMDTFGLVPFSDENSPIGGGFNPSQVDRVTIFNYIVGELEALAADGSAMPEAQSNYPRADKGSVLGLLARIYLNAEVYTGTAMWAEAKTTCERIYDLGYRTAPTHAELFRGDNGENPDARNEFLFAIAYDTNRTQSWGGSTYLTLATVAAEDVKVPQYEIGEDGEPDKEKPIKDEKGEVVTKFQNMNGGNDGWAGNRVPYEYVKKYFSVRNQDYEEGTYDCADARGQYFYIKGRSESMANNKINVFLNGWSCLKFNNTPHDKTNEEYVEEAKLITHSNIDWPLIRLGEIHLIYAEACMHVGGDASAKIAELTTRAGVDAPAAITEEFLMAERARELMWEGHRRTDLIRYGKWISGYNWPYKGGNETGQDLPAHFNIFPIPSSELSTNLDLNQNPGYDK